MLDTAHGCPAGGIEVTLQRLAPEHDETIVTVTLNADGRSPAALLYGERFVPGRYLLTFEVAAYFREKGATLAEPPFLDRVPIEFAVADPSLHYHVPLLVSPFAYSTYRGS